MYIFNSAPRRKRSHGHRHYASPIFHDVSLNGLLPFMQKPLGMHHIRSKLFSLPLSKLHALCNSCLVNNVTNPPPFYKRSEIVRFPTIYRLSLRPFHKNCRNFIYDFRFTTCGYDVFFVRRYENRLIYRGRAPICICIEYAVVPGKRFLYNGRERRPDLLALVR
jgi:hypothetical protein